jgi:myo-inositol 2-dehydrogenase/D-chiro-inositol 1-dehydrogenase
MAQRWAILGYGAFGRHHARCLADCPGVELAAIASSSAENQAAARADHPGVRVSADWRAVVEAPDLDAVAIVTPNHLHAVMALAALEAGKAVLVEKPLATTLADCDRLVEAAERTGRPLSVGFELRQGAQWATIERLVREGPVGRPRFVRLGLFRFPFRPGGRGWRHDPARVGSWILEEPIHHIDLLLWWCAACGEPVEVTAQGRLRPDGLAPSFTAGLRFADGTIASLAQTLEGFGHHLAVELVGTEGALRSSWSAADARSEHPVFELRARRHGSEEEEDHTPAASGELVELALQARATAAAFARARPLVPAEDGRRAVEVALAIEESLRSGGPVRLAEGATGRQQPGRQ